MRTIQRTCGKVLKAFVALLLLKLLFHASICSASNFVDDSEICAAGLSIGVRTFLGARRLQLPLRDCYTVVAADYESCETEIWSRPRFVVIMKRVDDDVHSKLKVITNQEVIEAERLINEPMPIDRKLIHLKIDGQRIPYDNEHIAHTVVDNLCTVDFNDDNSAVELRNHDFWLRFNGSVLEFRLLKAVDKPARVCGFCSPNENGNVGVNVVTKKGRTRHQMEHVRNALAAGKLMKDEHEMCRIRAENPPSAKCEVSAGDGVRPFYDNARLPAPIDTDCYAIVAANEAACVHGFSGYATTRRPRFTVLMRRIKENYSKLKLVTNEEMIEVEKQIGAQTPQERKLLLVKIDGQQIPYNSYAMARSVVDNLCTVEFMKNDFSVVELQNRDLWLRFDGINLELRLLSFQDLDATNCGICMRTRTEDADSEKMISENEVKSGRNLTKSAVLTQIRASLSSGGFLADEPRQCKSSASLVRLLWTGKETSLKSQQSDTQANISQAINDFVSVDRKASDSLNTNSPTMTDQKLSSNEFAAKKHGSDENNDGGSIDGKQRRQFRLSPRATIVVEVYPNRVCFSTKPVSHCVHPTKPIFGGTLSVESVDNPESPTVVEINESLERRVFADNARSLTTNALKKSASQERVRFVCTQRASSFAQTLLNYAYRRQHLLRTAYRNFARRNSNLVHEEMKAAERKIEKLTNDIVEINGENGFTSIHEIPTYCTLAV